MAEQPVQLAQFTLPGGVRIGPNGVSIDPRRAAEAAGSAINSANNVTVRVGEPSPMAAKVEQFMASNGMRVENNGMLSLVEAGAFMRFINEQERAGTLKRGLVGIRDGIITFTPDSLKALGIDANVSAAPVQQPAPAAPAPVAPAAGGAPKEESFWEKAKRKAEEVKTEALKCTDVSHPEYNSPTCVDARKPKDQQIGG